MAEDGTQIHHSEARRMLDTFASAGATQFDVTWTNAAGEKQQFRRSVALAELQSALPRILDHAIQQRRNVIARPHGPGVSFVQLDDLKADKLAAVAPAALLTLETSPGNFQAWVALPGSEDKDLARRLRKGTGADATASGATRIAGSVNFKEKYAPDFPSVTIHAAQSGRRVTTNELDQLGLVAPPEVVAPAPPPARVSPGGFSRRWPSYAICLDGAPLNSEETGPDVSRADFVFCMTAITWGWSIDDTAERLMEESIKAQANGKNYAALTARNAALAVERRRHQPCQSGEHSRR
jgi:hypothetical protein